MRGVLLELPAIDTPHQTGDRCMRRSGYTHLGPFFRDQTVGEINLGAPSARDIASDG